MDPEKQQSQQIYYEQQLRQMQLNAAQNAAPHQQMQPPHNFYGQNMAPQDYKPQAPLASQVKQSHDVALEAAQKSQMSGLQSQTNIHNAIPKDDLKALSQMYQQQQQQQNATFVQNQHQNQQVVQQQPSHGMSMPQNQLQLQALLSQFQNQQHQQQKPAETQNLMSSSANFLQQFPAIQSQQKNLNANNAQLNNQAILQNPQNLVPQSSGVLQQGLAPHQQSYAHPSQRQPDANHIDQFMKWGNSAPSKQQSDLAQLHMLSQKPPAPNADQGRIAHQNALSHPQDPQQFQNQLNMFSQNQMQQQMGLNQANQNQTSQQANTGHQQPQKQQHPSAADFDLNKFQQSQQLQEQQKQQAAQQNMMNNPQFIQYLQQQNQTIQQSALNPQQSTSQVKSQQGIYGMMGQQQNQPQPQNLAANPLMNLQQQQQAQQLMQKSQNSNIHYQNMQSEQKSAQPASLIQQISQQNNNMHPQPQFDARQALIASQQRIQEQTNQDDQRQVINQYILQQQQQAMNPQNLPQQYQIQHPGMQNEIHHNENSIVANFQNLSKLAEFCGTKGEYSTAIQYYLKMSELDPDNGPTWAALGHCYLLTDDIHKAFNAYQHSLYCLEDIRDPQLWYGIGILYEKFESYDHAISALIAVLKMSPNFQQKSELLNKLGVILAKTNQLDQAVRYLQNSILASNFSMKRRVDTLLKIGILFELQYDFVQAQRSYEAALSHNEKYHRIYQHIAWCHFQQGNINEAIDYVNKADFKAKDNPDNFYIKARCFLVQQKFREAFDCFQQSTMKSPNDAIYWTSLAILLYQQNNFTESFEAIIKASTLRPELYEIWFNLGILYEKCKQPEEALIAYTKVLELQSGQSEAQKRIMYLKNPEKAQMTAPFEYATLNMKHPFYCVPNSLVVLRRYWNQDNFEKSLRLQNQPYSSNQEKVGQNLDSLAKYGAGLDVNQSQLNAALQSKQFSQQPVMQQSQQQLEQQLYNQQSLLQKMNLAKNMPSQMQQQQPMQNLVTPQNFSQNMPIQFPQNQAGVAQRQPSASPQQFTQMPVQQQQVSALRSQNYDLGIPTMQNEQVPLDQQQMLKDFERQKAIFQNSEMNQGTQVQARVEELPRQLQQNNQQVQDFNQDKNIRQAHQFETRQQPNDEVSQTQPTNVQQNFQSIPQPDQNLLEYLRQQQLQTQHLKMQEQQQVQPGQKQHFVFSPSDVEQLRNTQLNVQPPLANNQFTQVVEIQQPIAKEMPPQLYNIIPQAKSVDQRQSNLPNLANFTAAENARHEQVSEIPQLKKMEDIQQKQFVPIQAPQEQLLEFYNSLQQKFGDQNKQAAENFNFQQYEQNSVQQPIQSLPQMTEVPQLQELQQRLHVPQQDNNIKQLMRGMGVNNFQADLPNQSINPELLTLALTKAQLEQQMKDRDGIEYLPESSESEKDSSKDGSADKSDNEKQYQ